MYECMHAWMFGGKYVRVHTGKYACAYVSMCLCMYACMYARMHVCMYAWMHGCTDGCMPASVCLSACLSVCLSVCIMYIRIVISANNKECRKGAKISLTDPFHASSNAAAKQRVTTTS